MKKTKLGVTVAGVVLMASIGVPAAQAAGAEQMRGPGAHVAQTEGGYRFVVKYRAGAAESRDVAALGRSLDAAAARSGLDRMVAASTRSAARPAARASLVRRMALPDWSVIKTSRALNATEAAAFIRELKANPAVLDAQVDQMMRHMAQVAPAMVPDDPSYARLQWHFSNPVSGVRAPQAWERAQGEGVVVAVIDTGIAQGNPDLQNNVLPGYDMISDKRISRREGDERVPGGWDVGDWVEMDYCKGWATKDGNLAEDSSWHGTHVSGTVAQETNNGTGVAGLAYKAKVVPVRVLGSCGGMDSDISDGIIWAAGGEVPGVPVNPNPAEVINMSLGSFEPAACTETLQKAIDFAVEKGAIVVVAAGNDNGDAAKYTMSSCNNVISVGASRITGGKAGYSNHGPRVDLAAPGGDEPDGNPNGGIWQMINDGAKQPEAENWRMGGMIGTSMASPHVAAAVAMIQSVVETPLDWKQMRDLLKRTATPFPVAIAPGTPIGAGILNIDAALIKALEKPCNPEVETCGPAATALVNKVEVKGLSGMGGSEVLYSFKAEAGKVLSFMSYAGSGDVSMYVSLDKEPSATVHDARSVRSGTTTETVRFTAPEAGTYYIKLIGVDKPGAMPPIGAAKPNAYQNVTLIARQ